MRMLREGLTSSRPYVLTFLTLLVCASVLAAHDTWLLPLSFRVPRGAQVTLELTSTMALMAVPHE